LLFVTPLLDHYPTRPQNDRTTLTALTIDYTCSTLTTFHSRPPPLFLNTDATLSLKSTFVTFQHASRTYQPHLSSEFNLLEWPGFLIEETVVGVAGRSIARAIASYKTSRQEACFTR
jgi:hypothetical protein